MKRILLFLLVPILLVRGAVCQQPVGISPTLMRYTVRGEGFSVSLHSRPTMTTTKVSRKDGTVRTKRSLTTTVKSVAYNIEIFENLKPGEPLDEFIAESKAGFQYDPATERDLTVNGFPGKEYSLQTETTVTVMQFFATADRLFRFAATGPAPSVPDIKEFFSSIQLGPSTHGIDVSVELFRSDTGERVYWGSEVDVKPRLLKKPEPTYTKYARDNEAEGTVILRVVFSKTGHVEYIQVL